VDGQIIIWGKKKKSFVEATGDLVMILTSMRGTRQGKIWIYLAHSADEVMNEPGRSAVNAYSNYLLTFVCQSNTLIK
jgi:hypothetical protein